MHVHMMHDNQCQTVRSIFRNVFVSYKKSFREKANVQSCFTDNYIIFFIALYQYQF